VGGLDRTHARVVLGADIVSVIVGEV
jgi:hypothetical protein